jgi:hypothetical protein
VLFGLFLNVSLPLPSNFLHVRIFRSFFISFSEYDIHSSSGPCWFDASKRKQIRQKPRKDLDVSFEIMFILPTLEARIIRAKSRIGC